MSRSYQRHNGGVAVDHADGKFDSRPYENEHRTYVVRQMGAQASKVPVVAPPPSYHDHTTTQRMLKRHSTSGNGNPDYSSDASSTSSLPSRILATARGSSPTRPVARFRTISPEPSQQTQSLTSEEKFGPSSARATASAQKRKSRTPRPVKYQTSRGERREYLRRQIKKAQVTRARATTSSNAVHRRDEQAPVVEQLVERQTPTFHAQNVTRAGLPKIAAAPPVRPVTIEPTPFPFAVTGDTNVDVSNLRKMKCMQIDKKRAYVEELKREAEEMQETVKTLERMAEAAKKECEEANAKAQEIEKTVYLMEGKIAENFRFLDRDSHGYETEEERETRKERNALVRSATEKMKE